MLIFSHKKMFFTILLHLKLRKFLYMAKENRICNKINALIIKDLRIMMLCLTKFIVSEITLNSCFMLHLNPLLNFDEFQN